MASEDESKVDGRTTGRKDDKQSAEGNQEILTSVRVTEEKGQKKARKTKETIK